MRSVAVLCAVLLSVSYALLANAEGVRYYRYFDPAGNTIINDAIPPEKVAGGYDILNAHGRVIEVVPGIGTPEEQRARRLQAEQDNYDRALLRRYSSAADVEAARDRYLRELSIRIDTLVASLARSKELLAEAQAALGAMGVNDEQRPLYEKNAQLLTREIVATERQIVERKSERAESEVRFVKELERLLALKAADAA